MSKYVIDEQTLITVANAYKRGKFPDIFLADNKLTPQPILYVDYVDNGTTNDVYPTAEKNLIEYGYEKNNEGILTPVAYSNENHIDKYFYLGTSNLSGIPGTFDRWQKIETNSYGEGSHGWEINKCYAYTKPFMLSLDFNDLESDLNSLIAPFENPVEVAIPGIKLNTTIGEITSTTTQEAGYCKGGTQTETLGLPIMEIRENPIIPTTSTQKVVSAGYFVTEDLKVAPIPDAWVKPTKNIDGGNFEANDIFSSDVTLSKGSYLTNDYFISGYSPTWVRRGGPSAYIKASTSGTTTYVLETRDNRDIEDIVSSFYLYIKPQRDSTMDVFKELTVTITFENGTESTLIIQNSELPCVIVAIGKFIHMITKNGTNSASTNSSLVAAYITDIKLKAISASNQSDNTRNWPTYDLYAIR